MDHDSVADVETDVARLAATGSPVEDEIAGLKFIEGNGFDHGPLSAGIVGKFNAELAPRPPGEARTVERIGAARRIHVGRTQLGFARINYCLADGHAPDGGGELRSAFGDGIGFGSRGQRRAGVEGQPHAQGEQKGNEGKRDEAGPAKGS